MTILLASNNAHKRMEIEGILRGHRVSATLIQPKDLGFYFDVDEDGTTFAENAFKKAHGLARLLHGEILPGVTVDGTKDEITARVAASFPQALPPVLADDSGICVTALDNRPGVYSARYGNQEGQDPVSDGERNELLLRELTGCTDRTAYYVCNAVLRLGADRYIQAQETWHGEITEAPAPGNTGFGYDPIVYLAEFGRTVARIPQEQKDRISHRAKAVAAILRAAGWDDSAT